MNFAGEKTTIGNYEIIEEIGRGGMATVYLARDLKFGRQVAVKVLPPQFTHDPGFLERFGKEARILASIEHHAIVPIYDYGEERGWPYFAMRFMAGLSLKERLAEGALPPEEALSVTRRICAALDKAHSKGYIHRDIKPGNILFDEDDLAYLADFGIARLAEMTKTVTMIGTAEYMTPEQVWGEALDYHTDIYQMGVVLFEMLSGQLPFTGDNTAALLYKHAHEPVPPIRDIKADLPEGCGAVVERAMEKKPADRFESAGVLAAALALALTTTDSGTMAKVSTAKKARVAPAARAAAVSVGLLDELDPEGVLPTEIFDVNAKPVRAEAVTEPKPVEERPAAIEAELEADKPPVKVSPFRRWRLKRAASKQGAIEPISASQPEPAVANSAEQAGAKQQPRKALQTRRQRLYLALGGRSGLRWLGFWLLVSIAAGSAGWLLAMTLRGNIYPLMISYSDITYKQAPYLVGVITGGLLGLSQFFLLRQKLPRAGWWIPVSMSLSIALVFGAAIAEDWTATNITAIVPLERRALARGLIWWSLFSLTTGLTVGVFQWLYLQRYLRRAGWWILINGLAWILMLRIVAIEPGHSFWRISTFRYTNWTPANYLLLAAGYTILALLTGLAMTRLLVLSDKFTAQSAPAEAVKEEVAAIRPAV